MGGKKLGRRFCLFLLKPLSDLGYDEKKFWENMKNFVGKVGMLDQKKIFLGTK
jgi:hypothetical protein